MPIVSVMSMVACTKSLTVLFVIVAASMKILIVIF